MAEYCERDYADWLDDVAVQEDELGATPADLARFHRMAADVEGRAHGEGFDIACCQARTSPA